MPPEGSAGPDLVELRDLIPLARTLGIEILEAAPELVRARLRFSPGLCTVGELMHGGALMALADNSGGVAAMLNLPEGATGTATIESKTNFLRGVSRSAALATTRPLRAGRRLIVLETEIHRDDGKLAAKVTQTQVFHYPPG